VQAPAGTGPVTYLSMSCRVSDAITVATVTTAAPEVEEHGTLSVWVHFSTQLVSTESTPINPSIQWLYSPNRALVSFFFEVS
jgi:hypothetical protein